MAVNFLKELKNNNWGFISLSRKGFDGAVMVYNTNKGEVAVCFSTKDAFVVTDDSGLFGINDLVHGVIKCKDISVETPEIITGAEVVAYVEGEDVIFDKARIAKLGLSAESTIIDISNRLSMLNKLNETVAIEM